MKGNRKIIVIWCYLIASLFISFYKPEAAAPWLQHTSMVIMAFLGANGWEHHAKSNSNNPVDFGSGD